MLNNKSGSMIDAMDLTDFEITMIYFTNLVQMEV